MIKDPTQKSGGQNKTESRDSPKNRPARFVADGTFGRDGQITLHPLVWHRDVLRNTSNEIENTKTTTGRSKGKISYSFVIFDDVLADAGQCRPLAVIDGFDGASLVRFELADLAAQPV